MSETKAKALDDAAVMRQELQDQYLQQEQVASQVCGGGGRKRGGGKGEGGEEGRGEAAGPESQWYHKRVRRGRRGEEEGRGLGGGEGQHQYLQQEQVASQVCAGRGEEGRGKLL